MLACQLSPGGPVFLNTVGTFGIASAPYWWSRLAAAVLRLGQAIWSADYSGWALLFADDFLILGQGRLWSETLTGWFLLFEVLNPLHLRRRLRMQKS